MDALPDRPSPPRSAADLVVDWLRWFGPLRLVVTTLAIAAVAGGGYWLVRTPEPPVETTLPFASTTLSGSAAGVEPGVGPGLDPGLDPGVESAAGVTSDDLSSINSTTAPTATTVPAGTIVVYVAGAVTLSGVYELPADSRINEAVLAAGGLAADADVDAINLAAFVSDGDRIYVPRVGQTVPTVVTPTGGGAGTGTATTQTSGVSTPIDLNLATAEQLDELPGIGPSTAAAIVDHRDTAGPFASVDDLLDVRGIGPAKLDAIRSMISV